MYLYVAFKVQQSRRLLRIIARASRFFLSAVVVGVCLKVLLLQSEFSYTCVYGARYFGKSCTEELVNKFQ